jgi:hypothetical protein
VIPLRPLGVTEILDGAFTAIRWNPKTVLGASAIVAIATNVTSAVATYLISRSSQSVVVGSGSDATTHVQTAVLVLVLFGLDIVVAVLGSTILTGLITVTVGQAVLGRRETLGSAWRATRGRFWSLIGTVLLYGLFLGLGWGVALGVSVGGAVAIADGAHQAVVGVLFGVVGSIAATVFAVIAFTRWSLAVPVVMLESSGPLRSLGRSWRLVRRSSWRVWWTLVLAAVIVIIAITIIKIPFGLVGGISTFTLNSQPHPVTLLSVAISAVGGIVASTLTAPLLAGVVVLLYTDLLMRREGMDIKLQAAAASGAPGYASAPGTGRAADATWTIPASPAGGGGTGAPGGWPSAPARPDQPGWPGAPAHPGQPGWPSAPPQPSQPPQPPQPGWPGVPPAPNWPKPEDGGTGTGTPDPGAW